MNQLCIFCSNELNGSDEHVIPDSINGKLHSKYLICSDCNQSFGENVDPVAVKTFYPILSILGLKNAKSIQAEDPEFKKYLIHKSGSISSIGFEKTVLEKDGNIEVLVSGNQKDIENWYHQKVLPFLESKGLSVKREIIFSNDTPPLSINYPIGISPQLILLLNKIAIEYFYSPEFKLNPGIVSEISKRVYSLDQTLDNVVFLNFNEEIREFDEYEVSHVIYLFTGNHSLYCYIELFNIICAVVVLSEDYQEEFSEKLHYQDAITKAILPDGLKLKLAINREILQSYRNAAKTDFTKLFQNLIIRHEAREHKRILIAGYDRIKKNIDKEIEEGILNINHIKHEFIKRACEWAIYLNVYEFPYIMDDNSDDLQNNINHIHSSLWESDFDSFLTRYSQIIRREISIESNHVFILESFLKTPVRIKNGKKIVKVHCVLINKETLIKRYIPYKKFFEGLGYKS